MKKLGFVCLTLMVALGIMGTGYARWSDTVNAEVTANMGSLIMGVRWLDVNDWGADPRYPCCNPKEEDCASITCYDGGEYQCELNGVNYFENVTFTVQNGYPCYAPGFTVELGNGGTVPAKIDDLDLSWLIADPDKFKVWDWKVTYPDGVQVTGRGVDSLRDALVGATMETGETMRIELQLLYHDCDVLTSGVLKVYYHCWNGMW